MRRATEEGGQAALEFGGLLVLVAIVLAGLFAIGLPGRVARAVGGSVDAVVSGNARPPSVSAAPVADGPGANRATDGSGSGSASGPRSTHGKPAQASAGGGPVAGAASTNRGAQSSRLPSGGQRPYVPPKKAHGKPQRVRGGGFEDAYGNVWKWDPSGHAGPHWDVQHPDGSHTNVSPEGTVIGPDNFPNKAPKDSGDGGDSAGSTAKKAAGGAAIIGGAGAIIWWGAKLLSPACGPAAPLCAIFG